MIRDNIITVKERITLACARVNRHLEEITLVVVAKGRPAEQISRVIECGIIDIGENKVQEALGKYNDKRYALSNMPVKWHMVGHLQTNKVKDAVKIFTLIHSLDSLRLAQEIDRQATRVNKVQDVLVEIKTSQEESKFGLGSQEAISVLTEIARLKNIRINGLMTIAPLAENPENSRACFQVLRKFLEKINELHITEQQLRVLSMGMSNDFEVAIEEGSTMIRLGRAIFAE